MAVIAGETDFKPHALGCYYIRPFTYLRVPKTPSEHLILDGIMQKRQESGPDKKAQVQEKVANILYFCFLEYFQ